VAVHPNGAMREAHDRRAPRTDVVVLLLDCVHEAGGCAAPGERDSRSDPPRVEAGGYEDWLKRATLMQLRQHADREVLRRHPDLLMGCDRRATCRDETRMTTLAEIGIRHSCRRAY